VLQSINGCGVFDNLEGLPQPQSVDDVTYSYIREALGEALRLRCQGPATAGVMEWPNPTGAVLSFPQALNDIVTNPP
jgi:hypothetical protein